MDFVYVSLKKHVIPLDFYDRYKTMIHTDFFLQAIPPFSSIWFRFDHFAVCLFKKNVIPLDFQIRYKTMIYADFFGKQMQLAKFQISSIWCSYNCLQNYMMFALLQY